MDFLPDAPICEKDVELLEEFATTTEAYFDAVKNLQRAGSDAEIFRRFELVELARNDCIAAREAVHQHRQSHGCRRLGVPPQAARPAPNSSR
jgi:hypothetical protein